MSGLLPGGQGFSIPKDQKAVPPVIAPLLTRGLFVGGYGITNPEEQTFIEGLNNHNDPTVLLCDTAQTLSAIFDFNEPSSKLNHGINTSYNRILHNSSPLDECITRENNILQWSPIPGHSCFDFHTILCAQNNTQIDPGADDGLVDNQVRTRLS